MTCTYYANNQTSACLRPVYARGLCIKHKAHEEQRQYGLPPIVNFVMTVVNEHMRGDSPAI